MTGVRHRAGSLVALMAAAFVFVTPGSALASCVEPPPLNEAIAEAETVFVGSVIDLDFEGRLATFVVIEVWKGELGPEVTVNGGPGIRALSAARAQGQTLASSIDRSYLLGGTYLVVSHGSSGELVLDSICSNTQIMTPEAEALRPATAYTPVTTPEPTVTPNADGGSGWTTPTLVGVAVIAAASFAIYWRRRPNPDIW